MRRLVSCLLFFGLIGLGCTESTNQKNFEPRTLTPQPTSENHLPGQYIVTLQEGASSKVLTAVFNQYDIKSIKDLSSDRYLLTVGQDPGPEEIAKQAATSSDIVTVQPNYVYRAMPLVPENRE